MTLEANSALCGLHKMEEAPSVCTQEGNASTASGGAEPSDDVSDATGVESVGTADAAATSATVDVSSTQSDITSSKNPRTGFDDVGGNGSQPQKVNDIAAVHDEGTTAAIIDQDSQATHASVSSSETKSHDIENSSLVVDQEKNKEVKSSKKGVARWASALGKKASTFGKEAKHFGALAKKAIAEEARIVVDETRDLAEGVRGGVGLTSSGVGASPEPVLGDASASSAKSWRNWGGGLKERVQSLATDTTNSTSSASAAPLNGCSSSSRCDGGEVAFEAVDTRASVGESRAGVANENDTTTAGKKSSALDAIKQGLAVTKEVSKDLWKDLREVNQEVVIDIKQNFGDLRTGVHAMRSAWRDRDGPSHGGQAGGSEEDRPAASQFDTPVSIDCSSPSLDASDTRQTVAAADVGAVKSPRLGAAGGHSAEVSSSAEAAVKAVAQATAFVSGDLWRKTAGLRQGLQAAAVVTRPGLAEDGGTGSVAEKFGEGIFDDAFLLLPSTRANYVELHRNSLVGDSASEASDSIGSAAGGAAVAEAAVSRVRELGVNLAKRSKEVSSELMRQALELRQNSQIGVASVAGRAEATPLAPEKSSEQPEEAADAGIFEIGSESDSDLEDVDGARSDGSGPSDA